MLGAQHPPGFAPGWNGLARLPPMGWRSWNCFGAGVSQDKMVSAIDAIVAPLYDIEGKKNQSLFSAGYSTVGVDEGWEGCGQGVNGTQHDAQGDPVVNAKFPDMQGLVKYGHDRGLKARARTHRGAGRKLTQKNRTQSRRWRL